VFAPYLYVDSDNKLDINYVIETTGQKYFTYAFMNALNKNGEEIPSWNDDKSRKGYEYNTGKYDREIEDIRNNGGDIIISFGGYGGRELATVINDEDDLYNAYKSVIEYYNLSWIDLDIEGDNVMNEEANEHRNNVMLRLQNDYPNLVITYCLQATYSTGITRDAMKILRHAKDIGLRVDVVNVMAMNYGSRTPNGDSYMGKYAIYTAQKAKEQLEKIGLYDTKIGITPMIGKNDSKGLTFYPENAEEVLEFAKENDWIRLLAFWAINRDNGDGEYAQNVSSKHSSIHQELFEFTTIFEQF
ncbi:glycoside hydrolase family 18 protein, partial [Piromyces sp. E2]